MSNCVVKGCKSTTRRTKSNPNVSLHSFPKCPIRIKLWLTQTGQKFENIDTFVQRIVDTNKNSTYRMCSLHFSPESYYSRGVSKLLKSDAVPTIFTSMEDRMEMNAQSPDMPTTSYAGMPAIATDKKWLPITSTLHSHDLLMKPDKMRLPPPPRKIFMGYVHAPAFRDASTNTPIVVAEEKSKAMGRVLGTHSVKTQTSMHIGKRNARTSTHDMFRKKDASMWTGLSEENDVEISTVLDCRTSTEDGLQISKQTKEHQFNIKKKSFKKSHYLSYTKRLKTEPFSVPKRPRNKCNTSPYNVSGVQSDVESKILDEDFLTNDIIYSHEITEIGNNPFLAEPSEDDVVKERKFIVFESCLDSLLSKLPCSYNGDCNAPIKKTEKKINGTLLIVYGKCTNGHTVKLWQSQPTIRQVPVGNVLTSAALLFSGCHHSEVQEMFNFLHVPFISESTYGIYQKKFLFPTIDTHWKRDHQDTIQSLQGKPLCLAGKGQSNSPGFHRKYCTYALLDDKTKKIVDFHTVHATKSKSTVAMESKAFRRCVNNVLNEGLWVHVISTDRNIVINKIMREEYNQITHQFNIRSYCESFRKKLISLSKKETCKAITPWIPEVVNHLWAASCESKGNVHLMEENWNSILYHVTNRHSWDNGIVVNACAHLPLTTEEERNHPWIKDTTPAFSQLEELICGTQIQKELPYLAESCHTEDIEVFHNLLLKYLPKHIPFKVEAIRARIKLASLAHNANVNRPHVKTGPLGQVIYKQCFPKTKQEWKEGLNYAPTKSDHMFPMILDAIRIAV